MNDSTLTTDVLKAQISVVIATSWPAFAAEHPALAHVIDQATLSDHVARSLADDAAFQEAWRQAVEAHVGVESLANLVQRFVALVLQRLT